MLLGLNMVAGCPGQSMKKQYLFSELFGYELRIWSLFLPVRLSRGEGIGGTTISMLFPGCAVEAIEFADHWVCSVTWRSGGPTLTVSK
jgi:hypothetical protein